VKARNKRLIIGLTLIAALDSIGLATMVANPDLTERVIPALAAVQIFGFIAIAVVVIRSKREYTSTDSAGESSAGNGMQWVPWLFGFLTLMSYMRVGLTLLYIACEEPQKRSWFSPIAGTIMGCFFLWSAIKSGRPVSRKERKETADDSSGPVI
jgi:membrane associated rhomboid family serine protease